MLDMHFYTRNNLQNSIDMSEQLFKEISKTEISRLDYHEYCLIVDEEEYTVNAVELKFNNRVNIVRILCEILVDKINSIEIDENPNIKELREVFDDCKVLAKLIAMIEDDKNIYFSYE